MYISPSDPNGPPPLSLPLDCKPLCLEWQQQEQWDQEHCCPAPVPPSAAGLCLTSLHALPAPPLAPMPHASRPLCAMLWWCRLSVWGGVSCLGVGPSPWFSLVRVSPPALCPSPQASVVLQWARVLHVPRLPRLPAAPSPPPALPPPHHSHLTAHRYAPPSTQNPPPSPQHVTEGLCLLSLCVQPLGGCAAPVCGSRSLAPLGGLAK